MALNPGDKLGPYEIIEPIGQGGMGAVYRARDTRLGRDVAVKVSDQKFGERFEREARVISSLNHPNICTLHDVGENYLVMELVEGETLSDRIKQGAIPLDESLSIARQIADALEAAHEKGIVHRDLKPGNVIAQRGWIGQSPRLRPGEGESEERGQRPRRPRTLPHHLHGRDPGRRDSRHRRLHGPRAGQGQAGRQAGRYLGLWRRAV